MATIFAWTGALRKRGELDGLKDLTAFAGKIEKACFDTLMSGTMPKELAALADEGFKAKTATTEEFVDAVASRL